MNTEMNETYARDTSTVNGVTQVPLLYHIFLQ